MCIIPPRKLDATVWSATNPLICHSPRQPQNYISLLQIYLFWMFYINAVIQYMALCDWLLSLHILFIHVVVCLSISFLLCLDNLCIDIPYFIFYSFTHGHLCCFHFWALMNSTVIITHVHVFVWTSIFPSLEYILRVVDSHGALCLTISRTARWFSKQL